MIRSDARGGAPVHSLHTLSCMVFVAAIFLLVGCKKSDHGVGPHHNGGFDPAVGEILLANCATSGCHHAATKAAGLSLETWNEMTKGSHYGEVMVPFRADKSLLTLLFDGTPLRKPHPAIGGHTPSPMQVETLKQWINDGARNEHGHVPHEHSTKRLYVPNQGEDNVAIIDVDDLVVRRYVNVGNLPTIEGPHFVVANAHHWYVSLIGSGEIWKFDAHADTLVGIAPVPGAPALMALTPDGSKLYVSQFMLGGTDLLAVVNTAAMTTIQTISVHGRMPHGIRINQSGTRLYVANMMSDNITMIDVPTDSVVATALVAYDVNPFLPPRYMPMEVAVSPNDSLLLVSCSEKREVRMFDAFTLALLDSFRVGDQPWHLQFSADGNYCYVTNRRGHSVSVIHLPMRHVMHTITTPAQNYLDYPHGVDISRDGRYVLVSSENVGQGFRPRYNVDYIGNVCVIDRLTNQIVKVLEVGKMPTGLAVSR